jgi:hypothetical protein
VMDIDHAAREPAAQVLGQHLRSAPAPPVRPLALRCSAAALLPVAPSARNMSIASRCRRAAPAASPEAKSASAERCTVVARCGATRRPSSSFNALANSLSACVGWPSSMCCSANAWASPDKASACPVADAAVDAASTQRDTPKSSPH